MKYECVWTNDLSYDADAKSKILEHLQAGDAVRVGSTCIGHTRAQMVKAQGIAFMIENGAHEVEPDKENAWLKPFYAL